MNEILTWHDEQDVSWTYCGRFKLYKWGTNSPFRSTRRDKVKLWRSQPNTLADYGCCDYVGTFDSINTAKLIASIITLNEC